MKSASRYAGVSQELPCHLELCLVGEFRECRSLGFQAAAQGASRDQPHVRHALCMAALPGYLGPKVLAKLIGETGRLLNLKMANVVFCALADSEVCTGNALLEKLGREHQGSRLLIKPDGRFEELVIDGCVARLIARKQDLLRTQLDPHSARSTLVIVASALSEWMAALPASGP